MMVTIQGYQRWYFFSNSTSDPFEMAPFRFNDILPWTRFKYIISSLAITDKTPPAYKDILWEEIQIIDAWNHNMEIFFSPSYISFLDESIMNWINT